MFRISEQVKSLVPNSRVSSNIDPESVVFAISYLREFTSLSCGLYLLLVFALPKNSSTKGSVELCFNIKVPELHQLLQRFGSQILFDEDIDYTLSMLEISETHSC